MPKTCESCGGFQADCLLPTGDGGARDACWICAHFVTVHDHVIGRSLAEIACSCPREEIFPADVLEERDRARREARRRPAATA